MATLLLDQMLPARLATALADRLGEIRHVRPLGLATATDAEVFAYARDHGLTIVTKDADFQGLLAVNGPPPRVVWLRVGNVTTASLERLLRQHADAIDDFHRTDAACLIIRDG